jgi:hypothetical protein
MSSSNSYVRTLSSGFAGAIAMTVLHEFARRTIPAAPRLDTLGRRAITKGMRQLNCQPPTGARLQHWALAGDVVFNSLYFSLAAMKQGSWLRGSLLGLGAGLGAVALPPTLKLGWRSTRRTPATKVMTIGWYVVGGLATVAAAKFFPQNSPANSFTIKQKSRND